ncbi:MAG: hypothetical protein ACQESR_02615 [Planctomycetota bacterium]
MESCPTQAVLPVVGLAVEKVIRDWYSRLARRRLFACQLMGSELLDSACVVRNRVPYRFPNDR